MGDLPPSESSSPDSPDRDASASDPTNSRANPSQPSDNLALLGVLRQAVADKSQPADSILRAVTDAARVLTGAHGAALAMRMEGGILCRARSGAMAPPLGSALSPDSGISGECLRTARLQVCSDTTSDPRVDPDVCMSLGIRSIVVVPLQDRNGIFGILEAFSSRRDAFETEQVESLRALAEIAEAACAREKRTVTPVYVETSVVSPVPVTGVSVVAPTAVSELLPGPKYSKRIWVMAGVVVGLLLMSLVGWLSWRHTAVEINASAATAPPAGTSPDSTGSQPSSPSRSPVPSITVHQSDQRSTNSLLRNAAEIRPDVTPRDPRRLAEKKTTAVVPEKTQSAPAPAIASNEPPPSIELAAGSPPENLLPAASPTANIPSLGVAVSQGIVEAKLIRKVDPVYPAQARKDRITGPVVLDATIGEDGKVKVLKVIEGEPELSASAASAVRQWKYSPAILNGKAIEAEKRITVVFKLP